MIRLSYTCVFLVIFHFFSTAQTTDSNLIDSIEFNNPNQLDSLYYRLFLKYRTDDIEKAEEFAHLSFEHAKNSGHDLQFVKSGNALGYIETSIGNYYKAESYYKIVLDTALDNNYVRYIIFITNNLGNLYNARLSQYDKAIEYYLISLSHAQKTNRTGDQAVALNNIGLVYYRLGNYAEALNYYESVIRLKEQNGMEDDIYINYNNLGLCHNALKHYDLAIESFNYVLENCKDCPNSILAESYLGLGDTFLNSREYESAINYFMIAKSLLEQEGDLVKESSVDYFLAQIYYETGDVNKAIILLENSQAYALQAKSILRQKRNYEMYADIYEKKGEYDKAYGYLKNFILLKDSIFNEQLAENLKNAHIKFQQVQADEVIQGKEIQIQKNRKITILISVILVLSIIILIYAYRDIITRRKRNRMLALLVREKTKELRHSNIRLVKSRQDLDTFLYKTSHDIRGPLATLMGLTNLAKIESKNVETSSYLEKINETALSLNDVISRLTAISQISSQPLKPEQVNFYKMINEIVEKNREKIKYNITFKLSETIPEYIIIDKILMDFILSSLIDNAFKYYDPSENNSYIELILNHNETLDIEVRDNGSGIDAQFKDKIFDLFFVANEKHHGAGMGLYQAMLATERLNGKIFLKNIKKPTVFSIKIPAIPK